MNLRQKVIMLLTSLLTLAAAAGVFLINTPFRAQAACAECEYASQCYGEGSEVHGACQSGQNQTCWDYNCHSPNGWCWAPCAPPG